MKLLILRGVPASAKTPFAREWVAEAPHRRARVSRDDLREGLFGKQWGTDENAVTTTHDAVLEKLLASGKDVVVDHHNLSRSRVLTLMQLGMRYGATVSVKDFVVSKAEAIERDKNRERTVGESVIENYFRRFVREDNGNALPPVPVIEKYMPPFKYSPLTDTTPAVMVELSALIDGSGHVEPGLPLQGDVDWEVLDAVEAVAEHWKSKIILVTGYDEDVRVEVVQWLLAHDVTFDLLFMRPNDEEFAKPDLAMRQEIFDKHIRFQYNVDGVFTDRFDNAKLYRDMGLKVFQTEERYAHA